MQDQLLVVELELGSWIHQESGDHVQGGGVDGIVVGVGLEIKRIIIHYFNEVGRYIVVRIAYS